MTELKDVIHFYLGCEIENDGFAGYKGVLLNTPHDTSDYYEVRYENDFKSEHIHEFKLLLRPLSSMTEEEKKEYNMRKQRQGYMYQVHAENTLWLIQKGIDVFGLINSNQAKEKTHA